MTVFFKQTDREFKNKTYFTKKSLNLFIHSFILFLYLMETFFPSTDPSLLYNLYHYRQPSPYSFSYLLNNSVILSLSSPPSPSVRFSPPWQKWRLLDAGFVWRDGEKKSPSEAESAINLPPHHSFVHPLLLSFTITSSVSVPYLCLSVSPPSLIPSSVKTGHVWWPCFLLHAIQLDQYNPPLSLLLITPLSR